MHRAEFCAAATAYIDKHPAAKWEWQEHPSAAGFGFMSRSVPHARRAPDNEPVDDDALDSATAATAQETLICIQYIVYSATFQVPAFYFTLHDASGTPLTLDDLVHTTLFHRFALDGTDKTTFAATQPGSAFPLLSQGDHPTLGTPCWYLHPCESAAAVDEIMQEIAGQQPQQELVRWMEAWFMVVGTVVHL